MTYISLFSYYIIKEFIKKITYEYLCHNCLYLIWHSAWMQTHAHTCTHIFIRWHVMRLLIYNWTNTSTKDTVYLTFKNQVQFDKLSTSAFAFRKSSQSELIFQKELDIFYYNNKRPYLGSSSLISLLIHNQWPSKSNQGSSFSE